MDISTEIPPNLFVDKLTIGLPNILNTTSKNIREYGIIFNKYEEMNMADKNGQHCFVKVRLSVFYIKY